MFSARSSAPNGTTLGETTCVVPISAADDLRLGEIHRREQAFRRRNVRAARRRICPVGTDELLDSVLDLVLEDLTSQPPVPSPQEEELFVAGPTNVLLGNCRRRSAS
jgi:hypothetical protein